MIPIITTTSTRKNMEVTESVETTDVVAGTEEAQATGARQVVVEGRVGVGQSHQRELCYAEIN